MRTRTLLSITAMFVAVGCTNASEHDTSQPSLPSVADFFGQSQARLQLEPGSFDAGTGTASVVVPVREGTLVIHIGIEQGMVASSVTIRPAQLTTFYGVGAKGQAETLGLGAAIAALSDDDRRTICGLRKLVATGTITTDAGQVVTTQFGFGLSAPGLLAVDSTFDACSIRLPANNPNCSPNPCTAFVPWAKPGTCDRLPFYPGSGSYFCYCNTCKPPPSPTTNLDGSGSGSGSGSGDSCGSGS